MLPIELINGCILIPTYNNQKTLTRVINNVLEIIPSERVIVVNDGSTDSTNQLLNEFRSLITVCSYSENVGKGYALRYGFKEAIRLGFDYVITIDSDGQHFPSDLPKIINAVIDNRGAVVMGSRNMEQDGVPTKSSFGNKFSNFWFRVETGISLPDTQTGFRAYPLHPIKSLRLYSNKFELEIELIVRLAWNNVKFVPVPIEVKYDIKERVSHFRPVKDFTRISLLNTLLVLIAFFYIYPQKILSINSLIFLKNEILKSSDSNLKKSLSVGFGLFMGILPVWGFQLLIGIPLAILFRLNKVIFIAAANISIPPMIPIIVYVSLLFGQLFIPEKITYSSSLSFNSVEIKNNLMQYLLGACLFSIIAFIFGTILIYAILSIFRRKSK